MPPEPTTPPPVGLPRPDDLLISAAKFLIEGGQDGIAAALLSCTASTYHWPPEKDFFGQVASPVVVELRGPRMAYSLLNETGYYDEEDGGGPRPGTVAREAIAALLPHTCKLRSFEVRAELVTADPTLRQDLLELARGKVIHNQAVGATEQVRLWMNLRFRSATEVRIADALDQAGVLFVPNCMARLNGDGNRRANREPDFLICDDGRWGVLEVDGEAFHPSAAQDHSRDALFYRHGIKCVRHYEATRCYNAPREVVADFLDQLRKMYQ
jgi:hypothetical protein